MSSVTTLRKNCEEEYDERLRIWRIFNMKNPTVSDIEEFFVLTLKYPDAELRSHPFRPER